METQFQHRTDLIKGRIALLTSVTQHVTQIHRRNNTTLSILRIENCVLTLHLSDYISIAEAHRITVSKAVSNKQCASSPIACKCSAIAEGATIIIGLAQTEPLFHP